MEIISMREATKQRVCREGLWDLHPLKSRSAWLRKELFTTQVLGM